jgi:SOS response associated peptidase (SRAP)
VQRHIAQPGDVRRGRRTRAGPGGLSLGELEPGSRDRTPVILPPDRIDAWLDPDLTDKDEVRKLISGIEYEPLQVRPVSTAVSTRPAAAPPRDPN